MWSILPWEAGDIDIGVYDMTPDKLYNLLKPMAEQKGYVQRHLGTQVNIFCTPGNVGDQSGGVAIIFPHNTKARPRSEFIKVQTNGILVSYERELVQNLMKIYGKTYLEHKM